MGNGPKLDYSTVLSVASVLKNSIEYSFVFFKLLLLLLLSMYVYTGDPHATAVDVMGGPVINCKIFLKK